MLLCVCSVDFELQYETRIKTERKAATKTIILDFMIRSLQCCKCCRTIERSILPFSRDVSYLHYNEFEFIRSRLHVHVRVNRVRSR